jgi:TolB-like protein/Tfp pilus assembly protein PilF
LIYRFEDFSLDPNRRELCRGGELISVEPQVFDVLEFLIVNREHVVSNEDLIKGVWGGRIVSDGTVSTRINAVRRAIDDSGEQQRLIRTVPRKGYRFTADIRQEQKPDNDSGNSSAAAVLSEVSRLRDKPSIAVLPFANFSADPEQIYFADGIVDEIITALSRLRWLFVIARTSSFTYRDRAIDVRRVGRELGVLYVLEGSVRRTDKRVRIMAQLIDAQTGAHLWAERFDGAIDDVFDLQDLLTSCVVGAIAPKLQQAEVERVRHKPTESLVAYDYFLRGTASFYRFTRETTDEALQLFRQAIQLDPDFATPYGMAALCYCRRKAACWWTDPIDEIPEAVRLARRAVEFRNDDAIALSAGGWALAYVGADLDDGMAFLDRALMLSPNLASAWMFSGWTRIFIGEQDTAIAHFAESMRMSPRDPLIVAAQTGTAFAHLLARRYDEASSWAERAFRDHPNYFFANVACACTRALTGRLENARTIMARVREINPTLRISNLRDLEPLRRSEDLATWTEGMRKAGLPD